MWIRDQGWKKFGPGIQDKRAWCHLYDYYVNVLFSVKRINKHSFFLSFFLSKRPGSVTLDTNLFRLHNSLWLIFFFHENHQVLTLFLIVTLRSCGDDEPDGNRHAAVHGPDNLHSHAVELTPTDHPLHLLPLGHPRPGLHGRYWAPCHVMCTQLYSLAETPQTSPPVPPAFGLVYEGALGQPW